MEENTLTWIKSKPKKGFKNYSSIYEISFDNKKVLICLYKRLSISHRDYENFDFYFLVESQEKKQDTIVMTIVKKFKDNMCFRIQNNNSLVSNRKMEKALEHFSEKYYSNIINFFAEE